MFILNDPYVSDYMVDTIRKHGYKVLDNVVARKYFAQDELLGINEAKKYEIFYSNSENSIDWIAQNLPESNINRMIKISKDKIEFRKILSKIYPDYYFKEVTLDELKKIDEKSLKYPLVLKPSVGFLSFGVYPIKNESEFKKVVIRLELDIEKFKNVFPMSVVNCSKFIIEEMIQGEEYAIDAYFDENGKATILNIFNHPFFDENDVSDRVYFSSKEILKKYLEPFSDLLDKIGDIGNYKNFPFHLELRVNDKQIIPIELNPMRFCGWCITDIADFSWGINPYVFFEKKLKPDWKTILENQNDDYFYFTIGDIPSEIDKTKIKKVDYEKYLKNIPNPLDVRKIDYKTKPVFAIVFARCSTLDEIKKILQLNMKDFIELTE